MKKQWLTDLEEQMKTLLSDIIQVPFDISCKYHNKMLSITLINLENSKTYLVSAIRGMRNPEGNAYIDLFYVMPHFQGRGIGRTVLEHYAKIQKAEGEEQIVLKPVPVLPENYNPWEYFRLYAWLGGKRHDKMTRQKLVEFYRSAGFESTYPNDITSEMQLDLTA